MSDSKTTNESIALMMANQGPPKKYDEPCIQTPEYGVCKGCGRRHGRLSDQIHCMEAKIACLQDSVLQQRVNELEKELRLWLYAKKEVQDCKNLPRTPGGLVDSRAIEKKKK